MPKLKYYCITMLAASFFLGSNNQLFAQEFPVGCNLGRNSVQAGFAVADETGAYLAAGREVARGEAVRIVVATQLNDLNDCAFGFGGFKAVIPKSGKTIYGFTHGDTLPLVAKTDWGSMPSFRGLSNSIKIEEQDIEFCEEVQRECVRINYYLGSSTNSRELPGLVTLTDPVNSSSWSGGLALIVKPLAIINNDVNELPNNPGDNSDNIKPSPLERKLLKQMAALEARIKKIRERRKLRP